MIGGWYVVCPYDGFAEKLTDWCVMELAYPIKNIERPIEACKRAIIYNSRIGYNLRLYFLCKKCPALYMAAAAWITGQVDESTIYTIACESTSYSIRTIIQYIVRLIDVADLLCADRLVLVFVIYRIDIN